jgi:hypothetical protein
VLGEIVRARSLVEFKRRFCDEDDDDKCGHEVTKDWLVPMTPKRGKPMLLDPRLTSPPVAELRVYVSKSQQEEYMGLIHDMHYEWHLRARDHEIEVVRSMLRMEMASEVESQKNRDEEEKSAAAQRKHVIELRQALAQAEGSSSLSPTPAVPLAPVHVTTAALGQDPESDDDEPVVVDPTEAPTRRSMPQFELLSREEHLEKSKLQHRACKGHCKMYPPNAPSPKHGRGMPWHSLFPDPKHGIPDPAPGGPKVPPPQPHDSSRPWQLNLWDVDLQKVRQCTPSPVPLHTTQTTCP